MAEGARLATKQLWGGRLSKQSQKTFILLATAVAIPKTLTFFGKGDIICSQFNPMHCLGGGKREWTSTLIPTTRCILFLFVLCRESFDAIDRRNLRPRRSSA
jgi:hypothetical protein